MNQRMLIQKNCLLLISMLFAVPVLAAVDANPLGESASIKLIDHDMIDTQRRHVKLVSDAMADHIVVINFIYTDCTTVCPVSTGIMRAINQQVEVSPDLKKTVRLISLTLNPAIDSAEKMLEFAGKYAGVTDNWLWLTGGTTQVNEALLGLRAYAADLDEHSSVILVGNPVTNHWTSFYQFPDANDIVQRIHDYIDNAAAS